MSLALAFVTLPFVVRTVQPVLEELEADVEEAAASLGANRLTILRRIILPSLAPAIAAGAALSFARAISEYGSLVLLSGNRPFQTEVVSVRVLTLHRERQRHLGRRAGVGDAVRRPRRHRRARHRAEAGVAPWLRSPPPSSGCCASSRSATSSSSSPGRCRRSSSSRPSTHGLDNLIDALSDPQVSNALLLSAAGGLLGRRSSTRCSASASRSCWSATSSRASGSCRRCSTSPCRSHRSWSAWRSCWSTTAATAGSDRRSRRDRARRSSSTRPA